MSNFYIDTRKAIDRSIIGRVSVYLNGFEINKPIAAKSGKFGFVEFYNPNNHIKNNEISTLKKRGNVKIKISPQVIG